MGARSGLAPVPVSEVTPQLGISIRPEAEARTIFVFTSTSSVKGMFVARNTPYSRRRLGWGGLPSPVAAAVFLPIPPIAFLLDSLQIMGGLELICCMMQCVLDIFDGFLAQLMFQIMTDSC
ncbi:hypothetical protein N7475_004959 [Penicillium sp. IBT 31633x]|nr:hypothetical protein N7475_004959 [Penicillium sp. IBT 31633x]